MSVLRLSMVLSNGSFETLERRGYVTGDGRRILCDCRAACRWMARQMARRVGPPPKPSAYPLWGWRALNGKLLEAPPLRCTEPLAAGGTAMLLDVEVPAAHVLLSDLMLWHCVVNGWYICDSEEDDLAFEAALSRAGVTWGRPYPEPFRGRVEQSWERIFDLARGVDCLGLPSGEHPVQATFWELRREQVVDVRPYCPTGP